MMVRISLVNNTVNRVFSLASAAEQPAFLRENHTIGSFSHPIAFVLGFERPERPVNLLLYVLIG